MVEKKWNGMVWRIRKVEKNEKMEWLKWVGQTNGNCLKHSMK